MDVRALIILALKASIAVTVFSFGLEAKRADLLYLVKRPGLLFRSFVSMALVMPVFAVLAVSYFKLEPPVAVALIALSVSPVPPRLPQREGQARGHTSYALGLLVLAAAISTVYIPLALHAIGAILHRPLDLSPRQIAGIVLVTVIVPLLAGAMVRTISRDFAIKMVRPVGRLAMALLLVGAIPVLIATWSDITSLVGNGSVLAFLTFVIVGLAAGHLLGGPEPSDRTVLALSTGIRHPAVAMGIGTVNFPAQKLVPAAIGLYLLVNFLASVPYLLARRRAATQSVGQNA